MANLIFISRHNLTNGQVACLPLIGYDGWEKIEVVFGDDPVSDLNSALDSSGWNFEAEGAVREIGVVAPAFVVLALLRAQWEVIEFVNLPSSRQKGIFVCKGVWKHTLTESTFFACPLSAEEQEAGSLAPCGR